MMMINTSGTCATSKLIQCRDFGCYQLDVSRKFDQDPDGVPDLSRADFLARKNVLGQVAGWVEEHGKRGITEWVPIAYVYEVRVYPPVSCCAANIPFQIVKASAKRTVCACLTLYSRVRHSDVPAERLGPPVVHGPDDDALPDYHGLPRHLRCVFQCSHAA